MRLHSPGGVMRRREFIALLGSASTVWPVAARAQQQPMPTIGILGSTSSRVQANFLRAFLQGLGEAGYVEGRVALRLNTVGQTTRTKNYRRWRRIWFAVRSM